MIFPNLKNRFESSLQYLINDPARNIFLSYYEQALKNFISDCDSLLKAIHENNYDECECFQLLDFIETIKAEHYEPHINCIKYFNTTSSLISAWIDTLHLNKENSTFYNISNKIIDNYNVLKEHYQHCIDSLDHFNNKMNDKEADLFILYAVTIILIYYSLAEFDEIQQYRIQQIFISRFEPILEEHDAIISEKIAHELMKAPKTMLQSFCYWMLQRNIINRKIYDEMIQANESKDNFRLKTIVGQNDIIRCYISKFYYIIELVNTIKLEFFAHFFNPERVIKPIENLYNKVLRTTISKRGDYKTMVLLAGTYKDISDSHVSIDKENKYIIDNFFASEALHYRYSQTIKQYEFWKNHFAKQTKHVVEIETRTGIQIRRSAASSVPENIQELNLNPAVNVNQLDEFIKYLAWRNYISEDDIESFKYIVFGGQSPSDFNKEMKFSFDIEGAKPLLANILWRLRKNAPNQIIVIFGENVTQSNWSIGTKPASQRVFVDLCLFFPFLINKLKFKNNKNVETVKNKLSTCVIELLHDNKDKPYSLRDIQNLEISKGEYWIVK